MKLVRGILVATVASLALTGAPVAHAAEAAAPAAPRAGKDWQVLKTWKNSTVRACRSAYDSGSDSYRLVVQLVNRAEQGGRGAVLGAREHGVDGPWDRLPVGPVGPQSKEVVFRTSVDGRPGAFDLRGRITRGDDTSAWGRTVRLNNLSVC